MAAKYFLRLVNGVINAIQATVASAGAANGGDLVALDDSGHLDATVMPVGYGADAKQYLASETLAAGAMVNLYDNAGTINARNADSSVQGKEANGFTLQAATGSTQATVYFSRLNTALSGLTDGARYYLGTAGGITATPVSGANKAHQFVGKAVSTSALAFEPDDVVYLN